MTDRPCRVCGSVLVRRPHEVPSRFAKRKSCGCNGGAAKMSATKLSPRQVKACAACGELFHQQDHEIPRRFNARKTCSKACRFVLLSQANREPDTTRICEQCEKPFTRQARENATDFKGRMTCSQRCKAARTSVIRREASVARCTPKPCPVCGVFFALRDNEEPWEFAKRVTCSLECSYAIRTAAFEGRERTSPYPKRWFQYREEIRQRDNHTCQMCGITSPDGHKLPVHHINYDKHDLSPSNLITLCQHCHGKTHGNRDEWIAYFTRKDHDHEL